MSQVTNTTVIRGRIDLIFDRVTTARYWTEWHPSTVAVSGQIDGPMRLGDVIRERARIGGIEAENDWMVTELERPTKVVLSMPGTRLGDLQISYRLTPLGDQVEFTRELVFDASRLPEPLRTRVMEQMHSDSQIAVERIKQMMETQQADITPVHR